MLGFEREAVDPLEEFARKCHLQRASVVLDLDGTALLEQQGKVLISNAVEKGVRAIHDLERPVIINTLRFPISVLSTIGEAWYQITDSPILTVLLNGSFIGYIVREGTGLVYQELMAFPMKEPEIELIIEGIQHLIKDNVHDLLLFFYSRNWREGESLWTPQPEKIEGLKEKYVSAHRVFNGDLRQLREELLSRDICMACLFIDRPEDTLMAYQHSRRNNFFTARGVNKSSGLHALAKKLDLSLEDSFGAGDTEMDTFLAEVGLAAIVGPADLPFQGKRQTVRVADPDELGFLISRFAELIRASQ